jgi:hypothetical protein
MIFCKYLLQRSCLPVCFKYEHYYSFIRFVYYLLVLDLWLIILNSQTVEGVLDPMHQCTVLRPHLGDTDRRKVTCYV